MPLLCLQHNSAGKLNSLRQLAHPSGCGGMLRWPAVSRDAPAEDADAAQAGGGAVGTQAAQVAQGQGVAERDGASEAEESVDILVDFRDPAAAHVSLYGVDTVLTPAGPTRSSFCTPLLTGLDLAAAGGGGYLAVLTHTKLSGFGHLKVEVTPPNRVGQVDLSRTLQKG